LATKSAIAQKAEKERTAIIVAEQEQRRLEREATALILRMAASCHALVKNSSAGVKVYNCYNDVLAMDSTNATALKGIDKLEDRYTKKIAKSLKDKQLGAADTAYQVLRMLDPKVAKNRYSSDLERLRKNTYDNTRKTLIPTF
jgi:hypothetical protein